MLEQLAKDNAKKVRIVKVNANQNREWAQEENISGVPTVQFYRKGEKVHQFSGPRRGVLGRPDRWERKEQRSSIGKLSDVVVSPSVRKRQQQQQQKQQQQQQADSKPPLYKHTSTQTHNYLITKSHQQTNTNVQNPPGPRVRQFSL